MRTRMPGRRDCARLHLVEGENGYMALHNATSRSTRERSRRHLVADIVA